MEILIKIPDEDYKFIKDMCYLICGRSCKTIQKNVINAIQNGTPLPKGHGRLIAEPTETDISNTVGGDNDFAECIRDSVKAVFDNAKTIIEADKE